MEKLYEFIKNKKDIASFLGVTRMTIHNWQSGKRSPYKFTAKYFRLINYILENEGFDKLKQIMEGE